MKDSENWTVSPSRPYFKFIRQAFCARIGCSLINRSASLLVLSSPQVFKVTSVISELIFELTFPFNADNVWVMKEFWESIKRRLQTLHQSLKELADAIKEE